MNTRETAAAYNSKLWNRNFSLLFAGQTGSETVSVCYSFAMLLWLSETFQSFAVAGYMTAIIGLSSLVGGLLGGTAADRSDRRALLIRLDCLRGLLLLSFFVIFIFSSFRAEQLGMVYVVVGALLALGSGSAHAITGALIPSWVPKRDLAKAVGWAQFAYHGAGMIGRGLAGFCYISLGAAMIIFANGLSFLLAALCLLPTTTTPQENTPANGTTFTTDFRQGLVVVWAQIPIRRIMVSCCLINFFTAPLPLFLVFDLESSQASPTIFGLQMLCLSVGSLTGHALFSRLHQKLAYRLAPRSLVLLALPFLALIQESLWFSFAALLILGFLAALFNASTYCYLQEQSVACQRGRILGIYTALCSLMAPLGLAFSATISQHQHFDSHAFYWLSALALLVGALYLGLNAQDHQKAIF